MIVAPDTPIVRFIYWLVNTPGVGGVGVVAMITACLGSFVLTLRWIVRGGQVDDTTTYAYPTPTLLEPE